MRDELKRACRWALHEASGMNLWTLGLTDPINPRLMLWLCQCFEVLDCKPLPGGTIALRLRANRQNCALLMELPKPQGGSRHECNYVAW